MPWQLAQFLAFAVLWLKVDGFQAEVVWQSEHWPGQWLAGASLVWQLAQLVVSRAVWLKLAGFQASVEWHRLHSWV